MGRDEKKGREGTGAEVRRRSPPPEVQALSAPLPRFARPGCRASRDPGAGPWGEGGRRREARSAGPRVPSEGSQGDGLTALTVEGGRGTGGGGGAGARGGWRRGPRLKKRARSRRPLCPRPTGQARGGGGAGGAGPTRGGGGGLGSGGPAAATRAARA